MLILLTNDDGVRAEGIWALYRELASWAEVTVVAPDVERSATGHALTIDLPLRAERVDLGPGRGPAWEVRGTPADCVKLGVRTVLNRAPDLVLSGINRGSNLGVDVFYSGTVSGAIEGALLGIPSVALSLAGRNDPLDYRPAARFARWLAARVVERGLPSACLLNVNVPAVTESELAGVAVTRLGLNRSYRDSFERRLDPRRRAYYWLVSQPEEGDWEADTDIGAVRSRRISVTPLHIDLTCHRLRQELSTWDWPLPGRAGDRGEGGGDG
ncbi:MAG: 5'/3'-nucleotidase SurE [Acetobacteraceae bacterium]|nr:5'/3'-nucleotidase SurE [Acetobacteraceae bacterium]